MANLPQVLEVPTAYGGGAGIPARTPSRNELWVTQVTRGIATQMLGVPRIAAGALMRRASGGCCPCPGQQGMRGPYDQTPYSEPGLGQPNRPQKPFQGLNQDPCVEALQRAGIDPNCLKKMTRRAPARRKAAKRKTTARRKVPKRRRVTPLSQARSEVGALRNLEKAMQLRARANAIAERDYRSGRNPTAANLREYDRLNRQADALELGRSLPKRVGTKARRRSRSGSSPSGRVTRGKYQLLSNGACYDPVRRKFVKRTLCK